MVTNSGRIGMTGQFAIIGAGIAGLIVAHELHQAGRRFEIFEQAPTRNAIAPRGAITINPETGIAALARAGLTAALLQRARYTSSAQRILDSTGRELWNNATGTKLGPSLEITRGDLRDVLLDACQSRDQVAVHWNHKLQKISRNAGDDAYELHFAERGMRRFRYVIGADGPRSLVRRFLTPTTYAYNGVSFVILQIAPGITASSPLLRRISEGETLAFGQERGLFIRKCADGTTRLYAALRMNEGDFPGLGIDPRDPAAAREALHAQFLDWSPSLRDILLLAEDEMEIRTVKALPPGFRFTHNPTATLVGDAARLAGPLFGAGANYALHDGVALATAMHKESDVSQAFAQYETALFMQAAAANRSAADTLQQAFSSDGARALAAHLAVCGN